MTITSARDIVGVGDRTYSNKLLSHVKIYDTKKRWIGHVSVPRAGFPFRTIFKSAKQLGPLYSSFKKDKLPEYLKLQERKEREAMLKYEQTKQVKHLPKANLYHSHEFADFLKKRDGIEGIFCFTNTKESWINRETKEHNYSRNYAIVKDITRDYPALLQALGKERQIEELILLQYPQRIFFDMEREDYGATKRIGELRRYALSGFTKALKQAVQDTLRVDEADVDINITDASQSYQKFSLHVVVVTRGNMVCKDGHDCAIVFALLAKNLFVQAQSNQDLHDFLYFYDNDNEKLDTIFDCSVYGGWQRNMRMIGACKLNKAGKASRKLIPLNNHKKPFTDFVIAQMHIENENQFFKVDEQMREKAKGLAILHHNDPVDYPKLVKSTYFRKNNIAGDLETRWTDSAFEDLEEAFIDHHITARKIKKFLCQDTSQGVETSCPTSIAEEYSILACNHLKTVLVKIHPRADIKSSTRNMNPESSVISTIGFFPRNEFAGPTRLCLFGCSHGTHECKMHIHGDLSVTYFCHSEKCPSRQIRDTSYGVRIISPPFSKNTLAPTTSADQIDHSFINEFCGNFYDYREQVDAAAPGEKVYLKKLTLPPLYPELGHRLYILHANMGTGKTQAIKTLISDLTTHPDMAQTELRILSVCFRQILGSKHAEDFGLEFYKDLRKEQPKGQVPQLSLQLDSLHKLLVPLQGDEEAFELEKPYDVLILDESHSIYKHFNSEPMKKVVNKNYAALYELLMTSKVIIIADADVGKLDLDVLRDTVLKRHEFSRDAIEYHLNPRISARPNFTEYLYQSTWFDKLMDTVFKENKRVFVVSNIKGETDFILEQIRERHTKMSSKSEKRWDYIHGDCKEEKKRSLADCEKQWKGVDIVLGTPALGAGIDFNKLHFHKIFVFGSSSTLEAQGLNQMRGRVRQTLDQECHIFTTSNTKYSSNNEENALKAFKDLEKEYRKAEQDGEAFLEQNQLEDFSHKAMELAKEAILEDPDFANEELRHTMAEVKVQCIGWLNTFARKISDIHDENVKNALSFGGNTNKPFTQFRRNITLNSLVELKKSREDFQYAFQTTLQKQDPLVQYTFSHQGDETREQSFKKAVSKMRDEKNKILKIGVSAQISLPENEELPDTLDEMDELAFSQKHDGMSVRMDVPGDTDAMVKHNKIKRKFLLETDNITFPESSGKNDDDRTFFRCNAMNLVRDTCNYGDGSSKNDLCTRLLFYLTLTKKELQVYEKTFGRNKEMRDPDGILIIKGDDIATLSPIVQRDYFLKMLYLSGFSLGSEPGPIQQNFDQFAEEQYRNGNLKPPDYHIEDVIHKIVEEFNKKCVEDEEYFRSWLSGILGGSSSAHSFSSFAKLGTVEGKSLFKELKTHGLMDEHKDAKVKKRKKKQKENRPPKKQKTMNGKASHVADDEKKTELQRKRGCAGTLRKSIESTVGLKLRATDTIRCQKTKTKNNNDANTHLRSYLRDKWTTNQRRRECTLYSFGHSPKRTKKDKVPTNANKNNLLLELSLLYTLSQLQETLEGMLPQTIKLDQAEQVEEGDGETSVTVNLLRNQAARLCHTFSSNPESLKRDYLKFYSTANLPELDINRQELNTVVGPHGESNALMTLEEIKNNDKEKSYLFCETVAEKKLAANKAVNVNYTKQARQAKLEETVIAQLKGLAKEYENSNAKLYKKLKILINIKQKLKKRPVRIEAKRNRFKELSCTDAYKDPKTFCQQICNQPGYKRVLNLSFKRNPLGFLRDVGIEYKQFN